LRQGEFLCGSSRNVVFEPDVEPSALAAAVPRIRYPADDTIIALDPDIPLGAERGRAGCSRA
jgi:hypothetical protein